MGQEQSDLAVSEWLWPHFTDSAKRDFVLIQQRSLSSGCTHYATAVKHTSDQT